TGAKLQPGGSTPPRGCVFDSLGGLLMLTSQGPRQGCQGRKKASAETAADNRAIRCNPFGARRPGARGRGSGTCPLRDGGKRTERRCADRTLVAEICWGSASADPNRARKPGEIGHSSDGPRAPYPCPPDPPRWLRIKATSHDAHFEG